MKMTAVAFTRAVAVKQRGSTMSVMRASSLPAADAVVRDRRRRIIRSSSVRRILSAPRVRRRQPFIWERDRSRPRAAYPVSSSRRRKGERAPPDRHLTWPCSAWGLHCRAGCPERGELLPHHFTLTSDPVRGPEAVSFLLHFPSSLRLDERVAASDWTPSR